MQPITGAPRDSLSSATVTDLLQSDPIRIEYGVEWLNSNLTFVQDITSFLLAGSTISSDIYSTIHRSCSLKFSSDAPFDYATDFVKPYMILHNLDTGASARFNLGVYSLDEPQLDLSVLPSKMDFPGLDLLYFLDQPIGDSYEVASGVDPAAVAAGIIASAVPGATVNYAPSGKTSTAIYTWPYSDNTTYLNVVNDLMATIGYLGVWVDWDGTFQLGPYVNPSFGTVEWTFDLTQNDNIVAEQRTVSQSFFKVPNWWRFTIQNLSSSPVEGSTMVTYIDNEVTNPGSYANRGRFIKKSVAVDAVDYASLIAYAAVSIAADLSPAEVFTVKTSPFPMAWHRDLIAMIDPNLATTPPVHSSYRRVLARSWELPLDGSSDMSWTWETITTSNVT